MTTDGSKYPLHQLEIEDVFRVLHTTPAGLSAAEAAARRQQYGPNTLHEPAATPLWQTFLANFTHLMALLLWAGGLVGFLAQLPQLGVAIWMVNLINGAFSFWQENRAERATAALRRLLPTYALVVRDDEEQRILAEDLVPGDLIVLTEGDHISADARLVDDAELQVDQSTLTGESTPVSKSSDPVASSESPPGRAISPGAGAPVADLPNLVFAGTSVTAGTGRAVVYATGMATAFGTIAHLTQSLDDAPSPLQRELGRVTRAVSLLAVSIGVLFFALAILLAGVNLAASFIFAMGMIVAFVPEGMLPTVTLSLALAVQRMARRHALVKRLSAVETLGSTTVICTDKTGTLTQNEMTVHEVWLPGHRITVTGTGYAPIGQLLERDRPIPTPATGDLRLLLATAALCTNAQLRPDVPATAPGSTTSTAQRPPPRPPGHGSPAPLRQTPASRASPAARLTVLGDPTEAALLTLAAKGGVDRDAEQERAPRLHELPFDSRRKRMSTIHQCTAPGPAEPATFLCIKGALQEVLPRCTHLRQGGVEVPLDLARRTQILATHDAYATDGLRILAIARRSSFELPPPREGPHPYEPDDLERDLTFLGLVAMLDPPRPEVPEAVARCHRAGIRIIMITGDYGITAASIARRIGILHGPAVRILTGVELDTMDDRSLAAALQDEVVVARASPEHKLRVVRALQMGGHIVAVTGDGVNDAPALKRADIGVAMGVGGTDVAREAADMILTDDNFASIVNAIEEGRGVFANIRKFAVYVFNSNAAEAVPFVLMLFSRGAIPLPLTVMQVLAIDLGTDMVPALGLGTEAPEQGVMERPPRSQHEPLLPGHLLAKALLWYGGLESLASLTGYFFLNAQLGWPSVPLAAEGTLGYQMATTMTLAGVVAGQIGAVFGCRTDRHSIFQVGFTSNRLILVGIAVELVLLALLAYTPPLQVVFNTAPLRPIDWLVALAWAPLILLADEARKLWLRRRGR